MLLLHPQWEGQNKAGFLSGAHFARAIADSTRHTGFSCTRITYAMLSRPLSQQNFYLFWFKMATQTELQNWTQDPRREFPLPSNRPELCLSLVCGFKTYLSLLHGMLWHLLAVYFHQSGCRSRNKTRIATNYWHGHIFMNQQIRSWSWVCWKLLHQVIRCNVKYKWIHFSWLYNFTRTLVKGVVKWKQHALSALRLPSFRLLVTLLLALTISGISARTHMHVPTCMSPCTLTEWIKN